MEMTKNQRVKSVISYTGMSVNSFSKKVGISQATLASMFNRGTEPKDAILDCIANAIPEINKIWLLTGEGEMINNNTTDSSLTQESVNTPQNKIKYYPNVNGSMGGVQFLDDPNEMVCEITIPGYSDCKFAINAYGDSMYPLIKSGQIILMSEWSEHFIDWGKIYLVITKSGYRVIKRLYPGASETTITCKSENSEISPPFEIEKSDVNKLYLVKGWICRDSI